MKIEEMDVSVVATAAVCIGLIGGCTAGACGRYSDQKQFEAAAKSGLVQKIDPVTQKTYWTKPTE